MISRLLRVPAESTQNRVRQLALAWYNTTLGILLLVWLICAPFVAVIFVAWYGARHGWSAERMWQASDTYFWLWLGTMLFGFMWLNVLTGRLDFLLDAIRSAEERIAAIHSRLERLDEIRHRQPDAEPGQRDGIDSGSYGAGLLHTTYTRLTT